MTQASPILNGGERERCDVQCVHPGLVTSLEPRLLPAQYVGETARLFEILADPTRLRILDALSLTDELCVCDLAWLVDMTVSAVSHQLRFLRERGVVTRRRSGRLIYHCLSDEHMRHVLADAVAHAAETRAVRDAVGQAA